MGKKKLTMNRWCNVHLRPISIEEANEMYDMGIVDLRKLIEWPFYSLTRKDSLALNQAKARIKKRRYENGGISKGSPYLTPPVKNTTEIWEGLLDTGTKNDL